MQLNKQKALKIVVVVAALVVIGFLISKAMEAQRNQTERNNTLTTSEQISSGTATAQFNPKPYTDRIYSDFHAFNADTRLYDELILLDDNKVRAIWKDWDTRLKNKEGNKHRGKTLGIALYDAYSFTRSYTLGWDWTYHAKKFYDKLKEIGLP